MSQKCPHFASTDGDADSDEANMAQLLYRECLGYWFLLSQIERWLTEINERSVLKFFFVFFRTNTIIKSLTQF